MTNLKQLTLKELANKNKVYNEVMRVEFEGFYVELDAKFRPTKVDEMGEDMIETLYYLVVNEMKMNARNILYYYIVKHFTNIGKQIHEEVNKVLKKNKEQDYESLVAVKVDKDLGYFASLIDLGVIEGIVNSVSPEDFALVDKKLIDFNQNLAKIKEEQSANKSE